MMSDALPVPLPLLLRLLLPLALPPHITYPLLTPLQVGAGQPLNLTGPSFLRLTNVTTANRASLHFNSYVGGMTAIGMEVANPAVDTPSRKSNVLWMNNGVETGSISFWPLCDWADANPSNLYLSFLPYSTSNATVQGRTHCDCMSPANTAGYKNPLAVDLQRSSLQLVNQFGTPTTTTGFNCAFWTTGYDAQSANTTVVAHEVVLASYSPSDKTYSCPIPAGLKAAIPQGRMVYVPTGGTQLYSACDSTSIFVSYFANPLILTMNVTSTVSQLLVNRYYSFRLDTDFAAETRVNITLSFTAPNAINPTQASSVLYTRLGSPAIPTAITSFKFFALGENTTTWITAPAGPSSVYYTFYVGTNAATGDSLQALRITATSDGTAAPAVPSPSGNPTPSAGGGGGSPTPPAPPSGSPTFPAPPKVLGATSLVPSFALVLAAAFAAALLF